MSPLPERPDLAQLRRQDQLIDGQLIDGQLIDGQYADRPHLRPVLDAVLAALPGLGPVTVQARRTLVSLVSPRRTFAMVQATTKTRVDLGLRLEDAEPGGRLLPARNLGASTLRIALTSPDEVDDEVRRWLQRAYAENTAPALPRRSARRPAPAVGAMTVVIEGSELPGLTWQREPGGQAHSNVHAALYTRSKDRPALVMPGNPWRATEPVPGDSPSARWEVQVTVRRDDNGFDFGGPFVRGPRADRHLGLAWGDLPGDGTLRLFRGAKLRFADVDPAVIEQAMRSGHRLLARVRLTDDNGNPVTARLRPSHLSWSVMSSDLDCKITVDAIVCSKIIFKERTVVHVPGTGTRRRAGRRPRPAGRRDAGLGRRPGLGPDLRRRSRR
jgi:hypothetical protein